MDSLELSQRVLRWSQLSETGVQIHFLLVLVSGDGSV